MFGLCHELAHNSDKKRENTQKTGGQNYLLNVVCKPN